MFATPATAEVPARPVRILIVAPSMDLVGGQSIQADLIGRRLREEPTLAMAFQPINPRLPGPLRALQRVRFLRTLPGFALYCAQLRSAIARCDVVHVFSASYFSFVLAPTPAVRIARALRKRVIVNYHSGEAGDHLARWPSAVKTLRRADRIVVPSRFLVEVFARFGLEAAMVPNAVELGVFAFRARNPPQARFLVNRNFEAHYNVACVLRAFALIQLRRPEASLTVAGDGPQREALEALAASLRLQRVTFTGRVDAARMAGLYDEHDVWLNASDVDNMPLSILEAYASGTAVVSTRAGGIPDLVDDGRTGRLVERGDAQGLADAALQLVGQPAVFARLTASARRECEQYGWDAVRSRWLQVYADLAPAGTALAPGARKP